MSPKEETMRRFVIALLGATAMSGAALAADMPVKAPIVPPPPVLFARRQSR
jgi:hypothetical protein